MFSAVTYVFWQNMPTHIQSPWLAALADKAQVRVVVESDIPAWRREMGWTSPDYGQASVEVGISPASLDRVVLAAGHEAVHIFSGIAAYPGVHSGFKKCLELGRRIGVLAECPP